MNATTRIATPAGMALLGLAAAEQWVEHVGELVDERYAETVLELILPGSSRALADLAWCATAMLRRAAIGGGA